MAYRVTRRTFLKLLAAAAGVSVVPAVGVMLPMVPEPIEWVIDKFEFDTQLAVGAKWANGVRRAVILPKVVGQQHSVHDVNLGKQALRQWYLERHHG